jgi:hypothetical protein
MQVRIKTKQEPYGSDNYFDHHEHHYGGSRAGFRFTGLTLRSRIRHLMKSKTNPQTRLYLISAIVLAVGLVSALLIYLAAGNPPDNTLIHDFENSKRYIHDLELYGGKMNVLADQFRRWFDGLWQGQSLAFMIAGISIVIASCCSFVAYHLPPESESDAFGENNQDNQDNQGHQDHPKDRLPGL